MLCRTIPYHTIPCAYGVQARNGDTPHMRCQRAVGHVVTTQAHTCCQDARVGNSEDNNSFFCAKGQILIN